MKKWLVVMMAVWLTSCSSSGENKSYYQLPIAQGGVQSSANQGNRLLWVEQIAVPDYLAGNGVVYQTSDVQYVIANNNLWASPLDQQLRNTLVANLSMQLPWLGCRFTAAGKHSGHAERYRNRLPRSVRW